jgi:hypothetical protein
MRKIITHAAGITAAIAVGIGVVAVTAPSADAASSTGSVTRKEGRKVIREGDRQKCLTLKEVRKMVHGNGKKTWDADGYKEYTWKGAKKSGVYELWVGFDNKTKCANWGEMSNRNGDFFSFYSG